MFGTIKVGRGTPLSRVHGPQRRSRTALFPLLVGLLVGLVVPSLGSAQVGINAHIPSPDMLDLVAESGVTWIRVDANWDLLQPERGRYAYAVLDVPIANATSRGLSVYASLGYTPAWVPKVPRERTDTYGGNDEPATSEEWVAFVEDAVTHFRGMGVTHFGMWNEPNLEHFWDGDIDSYVEKILIPGSDAVHRVCADCVVLGADLAHVGEVDDALDRVLALGADAIDVFAHHLYNDWPENGHGGFDGDSFLQALEMRRSSFTRASLREVLDRYGWTGEVWITETGYRATPGDAGEETKQETYVRRVLEEQLRHDWWTHTFFYEIMDCGIDQPDCTIDGFGLTRPTRALPRTESDYRRKPAFDQLRDFLRDNPEVLDDAPLECANGRDDDGDGRTDGEDRGCRGEGDDRETDEARTVLSARRAAAPTIDGTLGEWSDDAWVNAVSFRGAGGGFQAREEFGVRAVARWSAGTLYLAFEVTDDAHVNAQPDTMLWASDSIQMAFDVGREFGFAYDDNDHEIDLALVGGAARGNRNHGTGDDAWQLAVTRDATTTRYEIALPTSVLGAPFAAEGERVGFSFLANDDDGAGREGWLEWTPGIGATKAPYWFGEVVLAGADAPVDAGGRDAGPGADASMDDGGAGDAGVSGEDGGCGCRTSQTGDATAPVLLLGLLVIRRCTRRRRRGRSNRPRR